MVYPDKFNNILYIFFKQLNWLLWVIDNCHLSLELFTSKTATKTCKPYDSWRQQLILANNKKGKSISEITGIVRRPKSVVYRVISRFKTDKTLEPKPKTGRPSMTSKKEDQLIVRMSLRDSFETATSISRKFCEQTGKAISRKSVSYRLKREKLLARIPSWSERRIKKVRHRTYYMDRWTIEYGEF